MPTLCRISNRPTLWPSTTAAVAGPLVRLLNDGLFIHQSDIVYYDDTNTTAKGFIKLVLKPRDGRHPGVQDTRVVHLGVGPNFPSEFQRFFLAKTRLRELELMAGRSQKKLSPSGSCVLARSTSTTTWTNSTATPTQHEWFYDTVLQAVLRHVNFEFLSAIN